ncbi:MAG: DUF6644 family protein [Steroidobacteraceae bacterium]
MSWDLFNPFVSWLGTSSLGMWMGTSTARIAWLFVFHLFGLILLMGGVVFLSLRLMGLVQKTTPVAVAARPVYPVMTMGLVLMVVTGGLIFAGGAVAYFEGQWFRLKMLLLVAAVVYTFTAFRSVAFADEGRFGQAVNGAAGLLALLLWFGVAWAGRAIAYF